MSHINRTVALQDQLCEKFATAETASYDKGSAKEYMTFKAKARIN